MEKTERNGKNDNAQKAKLIFFSLAGVVIISLIWSFWAVTRAKSERNAVNQELDMVKSDNIRLEQMLKDLSQENESLKKRVQQLEADAKAKAAAAKKKSSKRKTKKSSRKQVLLYN